MAKPGERGRGSSMYIAVVEDDKKDIDMLLRSLDQYREKYRCEMTITCFQSGEGFLASLEKEKYTAVFLDIYLGQMDGIETARRLWRYQPHCLIIFLTSSTEHIWQAFKVHCFDYIDKKDFTQKRIFEVLDDLRRKLPTLDQNLEFICGNRSVRIPMRKIQHILSDNNYTLFMMEDGTQYRYRIPFRNVLALTEQADFFLNCNRGILLNMNDIIKEEIDVYVMKNGQRFPIRRFDRGAIKDIYHQYQFKKLEEM